MKLIYIAGPYTAPTACERRRNVQAARDVADQVNRLGGAFAVTPHFLGDGVEDSGDAKFWYDGTLEVMRRCDAVVVVDPWQHSHGTRIEVEEALREEKPVFFFVEHLAEHLAMHLL